MQVGAGGTRHGRASLGPPADGTALGEGRALRIRYRNPHVRFFNNQRGYVRCEVTPERWQTEYRVLPFVTRPGAPIGTRATFVVEDGRPGAVRV